MIEKGEIYSQQKKMKISKKHVIALFFAAIAALMISSVTTFAAGLSNPRIDLKNNIATWDCIYFGNYNDAPIKWRVLQVYGDGTALLMTDAILKTGQYNTTEDGDYGKSSVHNWLNGAFIQEAFSSAEQSALVESTISTQTGNIQCDLYLMSAGEVKERSYGFITDSSRSNGSIWWTRTYHTNAYGTFVELVSQSGQLGWISSVPTAEYGICPALKLNTDAAVWKPAGYVDSNRKAWMPISYCEIEKISPVTYNGGQQTPAVQVTDGKKTLVQGTDYEVEYSNNVKVGTATATIKGIGGYYTETTEVQFEIRKGSLENAAVTVSPSSAAYTGSPITPEVTVNLEGKVLTANDYDVSYQNNTNVGTASVTITGKGQYGGTKTVTFEITEAPKPQDQESPARPMLIATGKPQGNSTVKLSWNEINGAKGYTVSYAEAGNQKMKILGTTTKNTYKVKNLNKSKVYHFHVTADVSGNTIKAPNFIIAMPKSEKANVKGITVKNTSLVLKTNGTATIKASVIKSKNTKKALVNRSKTIRYYSSNEAVAVVNKKGEVTAVGKGTCVIYAVTLNGISKAISVTVTE